jgi:hypothetical protein
MTTPRTAVQPRQKARTAMPESERLPPGRNSGAMAADLLGWGFEVPFARIRASSSGVHDWCSSPRFVGSEMSMSAPEDLSAVMLTVVSWREFRRSTGYDTVGGRLSRHVRAEKKDEQHCRALLRLFLCVGAQQYQVDHSQRHDPSAIVRHAKAAGQRFVPSLCLVSSPPRRISSRLILPVKKRCATSSSVRPVSLTPWSNLAS